MTLADKLADDYFRTGNPKSLEKCLAIIQKEEAKKHKAFRKRFPKGIELEFQDGRKVTIPT